LSTDAAALIATGIPGDTATAIGKVNAALVVLQQVQTLLNAYAQKPVARGRRAARVGRIGRLIEQPSGAQHGRTRHCRHRGHRPERRDHRRRGPAQRPGRHLQGVRHHRRAHPVGCAGLDGRATRSIQSELDAAKAYAAQQVAAAEARGQ
jgi:hypothetical protein